MKGTLLLLISASVFHSDCSGNVQARDHLLHLRDAAAQAPAFQSRSDRNHTLQVLASDLCLSRKFDNHGQSAEGGGVSSAAYQQRVAHRFEGCPAGRGTTNSEGVSAIVGDDRRWSGFSLENCCGIYCDLFRRETGSRRNRGINLKSNGGSADGVVDAVEQVDHSLDAAFPGLFVGTDRRSYLRRPLLQQLRILREQFDLNRLRRRG